MSTVHVRIGKYRSAYHTDAACPSLNGKQDTCVGRESMPEEQARAQGLTACRHCRK
ncbi:hypothetical protein [Streptomyces tropicalis]|uniref:Uncharacterized protein n=1 Tax=Streptomyces tropicalis TaxID=3034234 RepID=A0ABT6A0R7_9ACTN|nr:hypothetical protein [Streptomyces tropicalis]MDF3298243.1 hypothetical protein [Streptomyces tropicalis]